MGQDKHDTEKDGPVTASAPEQAEAASFADLLEQSIKGAGRLEPGQKVKAVVVGIAGEWVFLDVGGKSEGSLARSELVDDEGNLTVKEGDTIEAYFLSAERNEKLFTTKVSGGAAQAHLEEACRSGIPVQGTVVKEIKGGFEVKVGTVRAFCPYSQMSLRRLANPEECVGQELSFRITEYGESGRNIILSRRSILEEERQQQKEALRSTLHEGMLVQGRITSVRDFGAFVDIGGVEGLIPKSEIGWGHVEDIQAALAEGQEVEVAILKLDWDKDRFSFSLKETLPDPWRNVTAQYPEGTFCNGTVARLTNFGAFVTLEPGVDGLLHISKLGGGRRINHPREAVTEGQEIEVRIDGVDTEKKRISLSLAASSREEDEKSKEAEEGRKAFAKLKKKQSAQSLGTLGDLLKAKLEGRDKKK